jgi:hypothetical protein
MNLKRGLFRIWVVASLIWFLGWLAYVWATCLPQENSVEVYCYTSLFDDWMSPVSYFSLRDYARIGAMGIGPPIAVLVLGFSILWAADGFRSHPK